MGFIGSGPSGLWACSCPARSLEPGAWSLESLRSLKPTVRSTDVAVVGAGPAGAWTAYASRDAAPRVTIFDPSHPREKPCGGGITGRALALVAGAIGELDPPPARSAARDSSIRAGADRQWYRSTGSTRSRSEPARRRHLSRRTAALVVACRANSTRRCWRPPAGRARPSPPSGSPTSRWTGAARGSRQPPE